MGAVVNSLGGGVVILGVVSLPVLGDGLCVVVNGAGEGRVNSVDGLVVDTYVIGGR